MAAATEAVATPPRPKIEAVVAGAVTAAAVAEPGGAAVVQGDAVGGESLRSNQPSVAIGRTRQLEPPSSPQYGLESRLHPQPKKSGGSQ